MSNNRCNREKKFRYPIENQEVMDTFEKIFQIENNTKELNKRIEEIQSTCDHEYLFNGGCGYEDSYKCQKCGKEIEV